MKNCTDISDKLEIKKIYKILSEIPDPEIPVLSILDLGVVRKVKINKKKVIVTITPTYSGCPAMNTFENDIINKLNHFGYNNTIIQTILHPAWTTEWLSEEAKIKLKNYGIAPPISGTADKGMLFYNGPKSVPCPQCNSKKTELISMIGSTACKAQYKCLDCLEPFDYFKCI